MAAAAVAVETFATCPFCGGRVPVLHEKHWTGDPIDRYAPHQREESSSVCNELNLLVKETRSVKCGASGMEVYAR